MANTISPAAGCGIRIAGAILGGILGFMIGGQLSPGGGVTNIGRGLANAAIGAFIGIVVGAGLADLLIRHMRKQDGGA